MDQTDLDIVLNSYWYNYGGKPGGMSLVLPPGPDPETGEIVWPQLIDAEGNRIVLEGIRAFRSIPEPAMLSFFA